MNAIRRHPALPIVLMALQALLLLWAYVHWGYGPKSYVDSDSYTHFAEQDWRLQLSTTRTIGYPVMLHLISLFSERFEWVPAVQFWFHLGCVLIFYAGLIRFGFRRWSAFFAASVLIFASIVRYYGNAVLTDAPGASLVVATIGFLLMAVAGPTRRWPWLALACALFASYQLRPGNLYLMPLVPLLGVMLHLLRPEAAAFSFKRPFGHAPTRRALLWLMVAAFVPYLLFCGLRLAAVGHFGLVSFGGQNTIGVVGSLVREETVPRLEPRLRPFAEAMIEERARRGMAWPFSDLGWIRYAHWFGEYNINSHKVAHPIALRLTDMDHVAANRLMGDLSWALIGLYPDLYARWVLASFAESACGLARKDAPLQVGAGLMLLLFVGKLVRHRGRIPARAGDQSGQDYWEMSVLILTGLSVFLSGTLLVALVEQPLERYIFSTAVFLPAIFALGLFHQGRGMILWAEATDRRRV